MNLPNTITILRMLLAPIVVWLLISADYRLAALLFGVAAISDGLDGWLARVRNAQTEVGAHLDPLADKMLLVSTFATLGLFKLVPAFLVLIVISRDVLIVGGLILARFMERPVAVKPFLISKANTVFQIVFLILVLINLGFGGLSQGLLDWIAVAVAALTVASGVSYLQAWFVHMDAGE